MRALAGRTGMRRYGTAQRLALLLLPSFLFALAADIVLFELLHPEHLPFVRDPLGTSRMVAFAGVLMSLWILGAAASAITLILQNAFRRCWFGRDSGAKGSTGRTGSGPAADRAAHLAQQDDFPA